MSEGRLVNNDTRNTKVVVCLILAATAGMQILLWLEPSEKPAAALVPLMAAGGVPVEDVLISYTAQGEAGADCLILADGTRDGRPGGPHVSVAVVPSNAPGLPVAQSKALLELLENMQAGAGGKLRVRLHPRSDVRWQPGLPPAARDLRELLVRKGKIE
jgi:hypothetical protein